MSRTNHLRKKSLKNREPKEYRFYLKNKYFGSIVATSTRKARKIAYSRWPYYRGQLTYDVRSEKN